MPAIKRSRRTGRDGEVSWDDLNHRQRLALGRWNLKRDWSSFGSWEVAEAQYWKHRALILGECRPDKRPPSWWTFEVPQLRAHGIDTGAFLTDELENTRR